MIHPADWAKPIELSHLLGNSMATNVLSKVLIPLIRFIQPEIKAVDPWETGRMQYLLRQSAMAERDIAEGQGATPERPKPAMAGNVNTAAAKDTNEQGEKLGRGNHSACKATKANSSNDPEGMEKVAIAPPPPRWPRYGREPGIP